ncbi:MAG: hypothetical protein Q7S27_00735 [Nanoarchaeota archaeon]|nr:hypothetical protein [Nanoarchaeota archaeon]
MRLNSNIKKIGKSINEAIKEGNLIFTTINEEGIEVESKQEDSFCEICSREVVMFENDYSWVIKSVAEDSEGKDELWFCSKKCWDEHILREAEEIRTRNN